MPGAKMVDAVLYNGIKMGVGVSLMGRCETNKAICLGLGMKSSGLGLST